MQSTSDELSLHLPFAAELEIVTVNRLLDTWHIITYFMN